MVEGKQAVVSLKPTLPKLMVAWSGQQATSHRVLLLPLLIAVQGGAVSYAAAVARAYGVKACVVTGTTLMATYIAYKAVYSTVAAL